MSIFSRKKLYAVIEKTVGETPLQALERFRSTRPDLDHAPLAYAGRLDPMASGKLMVLIGEECRNQKAYHDLDKEYEFSVLFGVSSDTADVLGVIKACETKEFAEADLRAVAKKYIGDIELPYPRFSSKTVRGKPLFRWTLEERLSEIDVPLNCTRIHKLALEDSFDISKEELEKLVFRKIDSLPPVTEVSKELGRNFRRDEVKMSWNVFFEQTSGSRFTVASFRCIASSGTYMRSLAELLARDLDTCGLALSIHRTKVGSYVPLFGQFGFWKKIY